MNKLIVLVLVFAIAAPALADDYVSPLTSQDGEWGPAGTPFRGLPGSTFSEWTYDDPCGIGEWDGPESSSFVTHPLKEDPYQDPCSPGGAWFSAQEWVEGDPCSPVWDNLLLPDGTREGGVNFQMGSWNINNFIHDQPAKDIWVQMTYWNLTTPGAPVDVESDPCDGAFYMGAGYFAEDPCAPGEEWGYWEDPCDGDNWYEAPLAEWDNPAGEDAQDTWEQAAGAELWADAEIVSTIILPDGWIHQVFAVTLGANPDGEWFEIGFVEVVQLDQIIIETICYVPEPATMVLLGLGSLMMIRRKKR